MAAVSVGHLNLIHPNRIQVLGDTELEYLSGLGKNTHHDTVTRLFGNKPAFVVISDGNKIDDEFKEYATLSETPLFSSVLPGYKLISDLQYYLSGLLADRATIHGVFMEVMGIGVMLTGESGIGKSELALELVSRGHRLIADDAPEFSRVAPDNIAGECPAPLCGFLEVRGLGILNIRAMFGDSAIKYRRNLRLIVNLCHLTDDELRKLDRLHGNKQSYSLLGIDIPQVSLPVAPGRNLAVLVESAVRNHLLALKGYSAAEDFIEKQQKMLERGTK